MIRCWSEEKEEAETDTDWSDRLNQRRADKIEKRGEFSVHDKTFSRRIFPGCAAVYFERAAIKDLFKVDLGREAI